MPKPTYPKDRFDDLPAGRGRVGAHRAENPRMRGSVVLLWAVAATVVLIALGIFGTLIASGRIELFPTPTPTPTPVPEVAPVVDPSFTVLVLNATPEEGLAGRVRDQIIAAGWDPDTVLASEAGSDDFPTTTVYYFLEADQPAALGLAGVIGGAEVAQSDVYQPDDDPATEEDESAVRELTVVLGLDRTAAGATESPTP